MVAEPRAHQRDRLHELPELRHQGRRRRDASTVKITLSQPWAPLLSDLSIYSDAILPENLNGLSEKEFFANPVGTGPFTSSRGRSRAREITLARNANYWQSGKPYLDEVVFRVILDDNQRVLQVQSGDVQVIDLVPPAQVARSRAPAA